MNLNDGIVYLRVIIIIKSILLVVPSLVKRISPLFNLFIRGSQNWGSIFNFRYNELLQFIAFEVSYILDFEDTLFCNDIRMESGSTNHFSGILVFELVLIIHIF